VTEKLWKGRFSQTTAGVVESFTASIDMDRRLYRHDIDGSVAHCRMLVRAGVLEDAEAERLIAGLNQIREEIQSGAFAFREDLEDIHMHVEARLTEIVGPLAQKLHTARSRNDQVALDTRLYLREEIRRCLKLLTRLRRSLVDAARDQLGTILPGYTHLQRAQPVLLSHHLMAYFEMFSRDAGRMQDCLKRTDVLPLGAAALAGTTFAVDQRFLAEQLDFPRIAANSMDAVSDRDFVIEFVSAAGLCMLHLSRLSEELVLWASSEFGFVELPDAFTTGSSIMPQKKNPDVSELVRGKTGGVIGNLVNLMVTMKALPLAYNRDMQEDKPALFQTVDTLTACLEIYSAMLPRVRFNPEAMAAAASSGYLNATDLADYLVRRGMPFRQAHHCVGETVRYAISKDRELHELTLKELKQFADAVEADVFGFLKLEAMVNRRRSIGGTALENVRGAIQEAEQELKA
jgi:argininosuccinate lyase